MSTHVYVVNYDKKQYMSCPFQVGNTYSDGIKYHTAWRQDHPLAQMLLYIIDGRQWAGNRIEMINDNDNDLPWWKEEQWRNISREVFEEMWPAIHGSAIQWCDPHMVRVVSDKKAE